MDSAGGAEAPKAPPLNPPLSGYILIAFCKLKQHIQSNKYSMHIKHSFKNSVDPDHLASDEAS